MLDSELIDRVDVNLGTTDVDSPTASATGGTVAYRTRRPDDEFGGMAVVSGGDFDYRRAFVRLDTGEFGPWGTKAFIAAFVPELRQVQGSGRTREEAVQRDASPGLRERELHLASAFHYNENRNAFYRTTSAAELRRATAATTTTSPPVRATSRPPARIDNDNLLPPASTQPPPPATLFADNPLYTGSCTNYYGVRINPSNTGNVRVQSLWHLGEKLRLTFDPSYQYTLANGGGTTTLAETAVATSSDVRVRGNSTAPGVDLNGDGDLLDTVRFYTPNTTNTNRYGATTLADLGPHRRSSPALRLHLRSREPSPDRPVGPA